MTALLVFAKLPEPPPAYGRAQIFFNARLDPPTGHQFQALTQTLKGIGRPAIVVAVGSCSGCRAAKPEVSPIGKRGLKSVGVFEGPAPERPHELEEGFDATVYVDSRSYAEFNAAWLDRMYLIDSSGKLLVSQMPGEPTSDFLERCSK